MVAFRRIAQSGTKYVALWMIETPLTPEEYAALGGENPEPCPGQPYPEAIWLRAEERPVWDTPDGLREAGDVVIGERDALIILPDGKRLALPIDILTDLAAFIVAERGEV